LISPITRNPEKLHEMKIITRNCITIMLETLLVNPFISDTALSAQLKCLAGHSLEEDFHNPLF